MKQSETFAKARQEKRRIFQSRWNGYLQSRFLTASLWLLTGAQLAFTLCSGPFAMDIIDKIGRFGSQRPIWSYFLTVFVQILAALPGWVSVVSLWNIRKDGLWQGDIAPAPKGVTWLKKVNRWVCGFGWVALFLYPTVTIAAGEYLPFSSVEVIFWLFVAMTGVLVLRVTLVRVVLRQAAENISCCWSSTRLLLPLIAVLVLIGLAGILWGSFARLFCLSVSLLTGSCSLVLGSYYRCLRRIEQECIRVDARAASAQKDPYDDPYTRY